MILRKASLLVACAVALLAAPAARAGTIKFVTLGTFGSSGTSVHDPLNLTGTYITYNTDSSEIQLGVGGSSNVSFGAFDTHLVSALSDQTVVDTFTLTILQTAPTTEALPSFAGSITGTVSMTQSGLIVQFDGPLVVHTANGWIKYEIVNADDGVPGRISIGAPETNNGLTSVNGRVTLLAVPEPSAFLLLGLGVPVALLYRRRAAA